MIALDTNILFPALEPSHPDHQGARAFVASLLRGSAAISELVLMEVYVLIRNPAACERPLDAADAAGVIQTLRTNPAWQLLDEAGGSMDEVWRLAARPDFARRRIYDTRLGISLVRQGVTDFATCNVKDFGGLGFGRVWNPLAEDAGQP